MRRRKGPGHVLLPADLVNAAALAGVPEMGPEDRRAWLAERGWTGLAYLRAVLAIRRAQHASEGTP